MVNGSILQTIYLDTQNRYKMYEVDANITIDLPAAMYIKQIRRELAQTKL